MLYFQYIQKINMEQNNKKTILVVEDEAPMRRLMTEALTEGGFDVIQAEDGKSGLAMALEKHPDLILLDLILPELDGMTVMQKLRHDVWGKAVPIILLTNLSANDHIMRGVVNDEPAHYLIKTNLTVQDVVEKVKSVLGA